LNFKKVYLIVENQVELFSTWRIFSKQKKPFVRNWKFSAFCFFKFFTSRFLKKGISKKFISLLKTRLNFFQLGGFLASKKRLLSGIGNSLPFVFSSFPQVDF